MKTGTKVIYIGSKMNLLGRIGKVVSETMSGNMIGFVVDFGSMGHHWCLPENLSDE